MNKVELNDQTLDSYDVLRRELKARWPDMSIEVFGVLPNCDVRIELWGLDRQEHGGGVVSYGINSRFITATFKRGKWNLKGDID